MTSVLQRRSEMEFGDVLHVCEFVLTKATLYYTCNSTITLGSTKWKLCDRLLLDKPF